MATTPRHSIQLTPWVSEVPRDAPHRRFSQTVPPPVSRWLLGRTTLGRRVWLGVPLLLALFRLTFGLPRSRLHRPHMAPLRFPRGLHRLARRCGWWADLAAGAGKGRCASPYQANRHEHEQFDAPMPHSASFSCEKHTPGPGSSAQPTPCHPALTSLRRSFSPQSFRGVRRAPQPDSFPCGHDQ
jgi:hypothetical protein